MNNRILYKVTDLETPSLMQEANEMNDEETKSKQLQWFNRKCWNNLLRLVENLNRHIVKWLRCTILREYKISNVRSTEVLQKLNKRVIVPHRSDYKLE